METTPTTTDTPAVPPRSATGSQPPHAAPQTLDVTGLSPTAVSLLRSLVDLIRTGGVVRPPSQMDPAKWSADLRAWAESQPKRDQPLTLDDSRESIYAGCGE